MRNFYWGLAVIIVFVSCKTTPNSDRDYADRSKTYKLRLNPSPGSTYYYDIGNQSEIKIKVEDKEITSVNKSDAGVSYEITPESSGNFQLAITYSKLHLYSKNGDNETDIDADNAAATLNPVEKMIRALKEARVSATVSPTGEITNLNGYKEVGDKIMSALNVSDICTKNMVTSQWEKTVGDGLIESNMEELFRLFPDSAVHIGDTWKLTTKQEGQIGLNVKNIYRLKAINDNIAIIQADGVITADNMSTEIMGYSNVSADLKGKQQAEYEMETKTGMLISCKMNAKIEGHINMMDREIPVVIETSLKINGKKIN